MTELATDPVLPLALGLVRQALIDLLIPAIPDGRVFWGLGGSPKDLPRVVIQPTGQSKAIRYIGHPTGWTGEIAIRVYAPTLDEAESLTLLLIPAIPDDQDVTAADDTTWALGLRSMRPIPGLPGPTMAVAGLVYRVRIEAT